MRGFKVDSSAGFEEAGDFGDQDGQVVQMLDQVHAGDGVHRMVLPRQGFGVEVGLTVAASGRIAVGLSGKVNGVKVEVGAQFVEVAKGFAVRGAEV